jgi:hypothetical protein
MTETIEVKTEDTQVDPPQVVDELKTEIQISETVEKPIKKKKIATEKQKAALARGREKLKVYQEERRKRGEQLIEQEASLNDENGTTSEKKQRSPPKRTSVKPKLIRETNEKAAEKKQTKTGVARVAEIVSNRLQTMPRFM